MCLPGRYSTSINAATNINSGIFCFSCSLQSLASFASSTKAIMIMGGLAMRLTRMGQMRFADQGAPVTSLSTCPVVRDASRVQCVHGYEAHTGAGGSQAQTPTLKWWEHRL